MRSGKCPLTRATVSLVGVACWVVGGLVVGSPVDAGIYVALKPHDPVLTSGSWIGTAGDVFTGYTVTLGVGTQARLQYDVVYSITDGATRTIAPNGGLQFTQGAIRVAGTGAAHITAGAGLTYHQAGTQYGYGSQVIRDDQIRTVGQGGAARAGVVTSDGQGNAGIGPQAGTFGNYSGPQPLPDLLRFEFSSLTVSSAFIPPPLLQGSLSPDLGGLAVAESFFLISGGGNLGDTLTAKVVGGDGANGTSAINSWAQYFESYDPNAYPVGLRFTSQGNALSAPLTVVFAAIPEPTGAGMLSVLGFSLLQVRRRRHSKER